MRFRQTVLACFSLFLTISAFTTVFAQTFVPIRIDSRQYPDMKAKIYALDATGMPQSLGATAVTATENGTPLTVATTCEPSTSGRNLSLLVALDITASNSTGSPTGLDLMKNAARGVTQLLTSTSDEIGLVTIDAQANLLYGMSTDKTTFSSVVDNVRITGGVNLTNGLMNQPMGALIHLQNARNNRALVLMTDGAPTFDILTTLGTARTFGIRVYVICMKSSATDQLKRLADSSGGAWVENITTTADATAWARGFVADAKTFPACNVSWTSTSSCVIDRRVAFTVGTTTLPLSYQIPANTLGVLETSTLGIDFGQPSVGNNVTRSLMLTARNTDVIITAFSLSVSQYSFITPPSLPLTIRKDQSVNLTIQYAPTSTDGRIGLLTFASATCNLPQVTLRGGSPFRGDLIQLVAPNGGETFLAGTDTLIQWTNVLPQEVVRLEISTNSGVDWKPLTEAANGLSYKWRPGPTVSDKARIRVSRTVIDPNNIVVLSGQNQPVYSAVFTADGQNVITGGHDGTVRLWNAFSGNQIRIVGLHSNWVWSLDVMPNTKFVASGSFDGTVRVWDYSTGDRIATIQIEGTAYSVAFTPNGQQLLIGTSRGITVISTSTWLPITIKIVDQGPVYDIDIAQSGDVMAIAEGTKATLRDVNTLDVITTCSAAGRTGNIYAAALSKDKSRIAAGGTDFIIGLFDAASGAQISASQPVSGSILGLQFSNTNTILAASGDGTAKIFDATSMVMQTSLAGHQGLVYGARFSPDEKRVVSAST
ncbi:MAG: VWA domain-containing protein, partial [Candidatus Kapabacteria bacterium]|nr:VWA domain-containing protein [Candidatus Kapabacteria bacterium]